MPPRTSSRRRLPPQDGGILAALSSNTGSVRSPPPKTLVISKPCNESSDSEEDVSILESPPRHSDTSEESSSEQEDSCEETDDEPSTEDEEDDDDLSSEEASCDSSTSLSMEDEDLKIDSDHDDEIISENNTEDIASDHDGESDPESDFDPDDTISDDEELEADEELVESKPLKKREKTVSDTISDDEEVETDEELQETEPLEKKEKFLADAMSDDGELEADEESVENKPERQNEMLSAECTDLRGQTSQADAMEVNFHDEGDDCESDDEVVSVIAEIVEDSDIDQSCNDIDRNEESVDATKAVCESHYSFDAGATANNSDLDMAELAEETTNRQSTSGPDQGTVVCEENLGADVINESRDMAEDGTLHFTVKSNSNALDSEDPTSPEKSAAKHKDREISFCTNQASKTNSGHPFESAGLMSYDLSISPIKSGFTPDRLSQAYKSAELGAEASQVSFDPEHRSNPGVFAPANATNLISTNPNLFSPIVARSTREEKKSKSESTDHQLSMCTPAEKTVKGEDPLIERSINRAIRSLLKQEKASTKTNIRRGEWVLGSKLGSGAFGVVHVGMNTSTGSLMAVKSIRMENVAMEDVRREIELLKSLDHPNIVIYHGAEMDAKYLHIFQEWVPGGSLCSMLSKFGSFRRPVLRNYLSQILRGLAYLHDERVMHRDLKGSNVLVSDAGIVKLADFGSSKRFEGCEGSMMLSLTMRGTPYFMAPEVFEEKYSFKADIWSVGCVAFQMATASPPWKEMGFTNPVSLFNHVRATDCIPTGKAEFEDFMKCENDGASLTSLLEKCFQRDPAKRPSAAELLCEPFFEHTSFTDDNDIQRKSLFNASPLKESTTHPSIAAKMSPAAVRNVRRNSLSSLSLPLFSPPLSSRTTINKSPLPRSPQPNPKNWPSWAQIKNQEASSDKLSDNTSTADSLVYSSGKTGDHSTSESSLMGLKFLCIS